MRETAPNNVDTMISEEIIAAAYQIGLEFTALQQIVKEDMPHQRKRAKHVNTQIYAAVLILRCRVRELKNWNDTRQATVESGPNDRNQNPNTKASVARNLEHSEDNLKAFAYDQSPPLKLKSGE